MVGPVARLQERGIGTLIITGRLSQVCCEATARDAMLTDAEHGGTLSVMAHAFCAVRDRQSMSGLIRAI